MPKNKVSEKEQLARIAIAAVLFIDVLGLYKLGFINYLASLYVKNVTRTMAAETERQQNQPLTIVYKTGERRKVRRVLNQGLHWNYINFDGSVGVCKKSDVEEIVDENVK
jgi:hypothetical protein